MTRLIRSSVLAGCLTWASFASAAPVLVDLSPSSLTVMPGDLVTVDLVISGLDRPPSAGAFDLDVAFDPSLLAPTAVAFGLVLGDPAAGEALTDFQFQPGIVNMAEVSLLAPVELDALQPESFTLASMSFTAVATGTTSLFYLRGIVDDAFGEKLVEIPEPATLILVGSALIRWAPAPAAAKDVSVEDALIHAERAHTACTPQIRRA